MSHNGHSTKVFLIDYSCIKDMLFFVLSLFQTNTVSLMFLYTVLFKNEVFIVGLGSLVFMLVRSSKVRWYALKTLTFFIPSAAN